MIDLNQINPAEEEAYLIRLLFAATTTNLRDEALGQVQPSDFASGHFGGIWEVAQQLQADGKRISRRSVEAAADSTGVAQVLHRLGDVVPKSGDFPHSVAEVKRCGKLRRLIEATVRIQQRAMTAEDHSVALSMAFDELKQLDDGGSSRYSKNFDELLLEFDTAMRTRESYRTIATPWTDVNDRIAGGLHAGRMYVVGARPGDGKSIAGHQLAEHAAANGFPAAVFSVEMGSLEVTGRVVSNAAQIEMDEISRRELSDFSWHRFRQYQDRAKSFQLTVNDRPDLTLGYIASECRSYKRKQGLDVVVIDYLQLLKSDRNVNREQQVAHISRSLKQLSRELEVAVVVPAQLNRKPSERGSAQLSDLRESGSIEADADVVMLLARGVDDQGNPNGYLNINIAKNRHGRIGELSLPWRPHYSRIG